MVITQTTYPSGYGTDRLTLSKLLAKHCPATVCEPEYRRRLELFLASKNGQLGIGDIQPRGTSDVSAASAANKSFHQLQTCSDSTEWCMAVDLVVAREGEGHTSWGVPVELVPVQGSADAKKWGLHANVGTPGNKGFESWHLQPIEVDGHTAWVKAGRNRPVAGYKLPKSSNETKQPTPAPLPTLRMTPPRTQQEKNHVALAQTILNKCSQNITVDGWFGSQTDKAVRNVQKYFGLTVDGIIGPKTWALLAAINVWNE
tara:strand:+ start:546 stop:1319 length:774 start_codon:yes stop_codon:yes gene_type:complete